MNHGECAESFRETIDAEYSAQIREFVEQFPDETSFWVEYGDLHDHGPEAAEAYLTNYRSNHPTLKRAFREHLTDNGIDINAENVDIRVRDTEGTINELGVADLAADHIGNYTAVRGQMSKVTGKSPLMITACYECAPCGNQHMVPQPRHSLRDQNRCNDCEESHLNLIVSESEFVDLRKVKIETPPDVAARSESQDATVYVTGDLCDYGGKHGLPDRAGEKCTMYGEYRIDESELYGRNATPEFSTWLDANAIDFHGTDDENVDIEGHMDLIESIPDREDPITDFREDIVPALEADDKFTVVLEGAIAWLFGSPRIDIGDGQYRGDIHMAVIGDPGTGKSTLLSELARIAPISEFRSGTGLTKVGLTAAAIQEEFAGQSKWTLQPGVLPRANGGHCIIDEVDDVLDGETKAIHDALEQDQMVKVDKAGITADLETRTALLASGNPIHGRFDRHGVISEQIDLDPALVSRMDILLDLVDEVDREKDRKKAEHYLESHDELSRQQQYERGELDVEPEMNVASREISVEGLRAWVAYAREHIHPLLTPEAKERLKEYYLEVRDLNDGYAGEDDTVPVTPRTLGAGVRLAKAFARCELTETVTEDHAERAINVSRHTVGLHFDSESGTFDAGSTDTGTLNQHQKLYRLVRQLEEDLDGKVDKEDLIDAAVEQFNTAPESVEHGISKLKKRGDVYEPKMGKLLTT